MHFVLRVQRPKHEVLHAEVVVFELFAFLFRSLHDGSQVTPHLRLGGGCLLYTSHPFLSIFFEMFFHFFPILIQAIPTATTLNTHLINEMLFCHKPPSLRVFF